MNNTNHNKANQTLSNALEQEDINEIRGDVEEAVQGVLRALRIDTEHDPNSHETAKRIAKMYVDEIFSGRFYEKPKVTEFPNEGMDELMVVGPIEVKSTCSHHHMPFIGQCYVGIYPGENVIGLSKYHRLVDWYCRRPQIQEELTKQISDEIQAQTGANGVAVVMKAEHFCAKMRGVEACDGSFTTSSMTGCFREEPSMKKEFFDLIQWS